jgi:hypothetical protein
MSRRPDLYLRSLLGAARVPKAGSRGDALDAFDAAARRPAGAAYAARPRDWVTVTSWTVVALAGVLLGGIWFSRWAALATGPLAAAVFTLIAVRAKREIRAEFDGHPELESMRMPWYVAVAFACLAFAACWIVIDGETGCHITQQNGSGSVRQMGRC